MLAVAHVRNPDLEADIYKQTNRGPSWTPIGVTLLFSALATGLLLRVGNFRTDNLLGASIYASLFTAHGVLAGTVLPVLLLAHASSGVPTSRLRTLAELGYLFGALLSVVGGSSLLGKPLTNVWLVLCSAASLIALWTLRGSICSPAGLAFLLAMLSQCLAWTGALLGWQEAAGALLFPVVLAILLAPLLTEPQSKTETKTDTKTGRAYRLLGVALLYVCCRLCTRFFGLSPLLLGELLAGGFLGIVAFRSASSAASTWDRWVRRIEAVLFIEGLLLGSLLAVWADTTPLNETLMAVAAAHFSASVLLFACLRGRTDLARSPLGWLGLGLSAIGSQVFCWGNAVLGRNGMPRRMTAYLDIFKTLQVITSLGAILMSVGLSICLLLYIASRRADRPPTARRAPA